MRTIKLTQREAEGRSVTWGKKSRHGAYNREHKHALSAAIRMPTHIPLAGRGSIGGAPIWVMAEAFMPEDLARKRSKEGGRWLRHDGRPRRSTPIGIDRAPDHADPDGFAVFGRFPNGWLKEVLRAQLLGDVGRDDILHVCSGTLQEKWTVDLRPQARPAVIADGCSLPFASASFEAVLMDPPYSETYAKNLYGTGNPRPSWLLKEAARVVRHGGRIGLLHVVVPFAPPACRLVRVYGVTTGVGFRIRAFTIYQREQAAML